ncbi:hypothetical protein C4578_03120 [Candidatus Microgenomates bacterium]|jgi:hypothetical protein|nr:MAG: hypothetical protein C4578_03120 [Candidatus Microgenomates bacterium]
MTNHKALKTIFFVFILSFFLAQPLKAQYYIGSVLGVKSEKPNSASESKRMTVGEVEEIKGNKISVEDKKEKKTKEIILEGKTRIINQNNKAINLNQVKPKDKVAIIATEGPLATDTAGLTNRFKVYVKQQREIRETRRRAVHGVITAVSGSSITLTHQTQRDRISNLIVTESTEIKIKGAETGTLSDLAPGLRIAAVGDANSEGVLEAVRIHVIPGKATGIWENRPLPSQSQDGTGSAIITATNFPTPTQSLTVTPSATPSVSFTLE